MSQLRVSHGAAGKPLIIGPWRLTEASYAAGQRVPRHEHELSSWTFVESGYVEETFSFDRFVCAPASVLTKPAIAAHSNLYGPQPARCLLIELAAHDDAYPEVCHNIFSAPRHFSRGIVPRLAARICQYKNDSDRVGLFSLEALLLELKAASARAARPCSRTSRRWLNEVRDCLEAEFRSPPSLNDLGRIHNRHPVYICQEFRSAFGIGVGEFVRNVRFQWAREAITYGSVALSDIALAAGFSDQAHFSRDFKRRTGVSPRVFRAIQRSSVRRDSSPLP